MVILQEQEAPPPGILPPMAWVMRLDGRKLHCWQQVALVTRCGGGRGMFPDILSPFIIFLIPQTSCRAVSAAVRPATEEGGTSQEPDHIQVQQNIRVAVFTQLLPISIKLCLLFSESAEREFIRFRPCLSDRMLIFKRNKHLWLLDGIFLPVRLVHKPNKCLDSKEKRLFRFSQDWLHLCSRSV